jgi:hypothetical protein
MNKHGLIKIIGVVVFVLVCDSLAACSKKPTQEECRAGIKRMMEIQIDELDIPGIDTASTEEQKRQGIELLKAQIPSRVTPEFVAQCVDRMKREDLQCTMSANTQDELVQKCHWKVISGPKGPALGF